MVTLEGKVDVNLLSSDGNVIAFDKETPIMISVDVPKGTEVKTMGVKNSISFTSKNCMFDKRTIDYVCGLLSPTEFKMPRKKHRKGARIKARNKRMLKIIEEEWYK